MKTKNFHWHMSGPHFRDYHLLLDEQGEQIFAMTDPLAERARKLGGTTLTSIGAIARSGASKDNDAEYVDPKDMLSELREDNQRLVAEMRQVHNVCDETARSRRRACWRSGSTRPSGAPGSCSRRRAAAQTRALKLERVDQQVDPPGYAALSALRAPEPAITTIIRNTPRTTDCQ